MDLRGGDPGRFQVSLDDFQVVQIITDIIVAFNTAFSLLVSSTECSEIQTDV
jgi:hypothetical protein